MRWKPRQTVWVREFLPPPVWSQTRAANTEKSKPGIPGNRDQHQSRAQVRWGKKEYRGGQGLLFSQALIPGDKSAVRNLRELLFQGSRVQESKWDRLQKLDKPCMKYQTRSGDCGKLGGTCPKG